MFGNEIVKIKYQILIFSKTNTYLSISCIKIELFYFYVMKLNNKSL